jgi:hypothetical protein
MPIPGTASLAGLLIQTRITTTLVLGMGTDIIPVLTSVSDSTDPGTMAGSVEGSAASAEWRILAGVRLLNLPFNGKAVHCLLGW